jgi:chemotaxis protein CheX
MELKDQLIKAISEATNEALQSVLFIPAKLIDTKTRVASSGMHVVCSVGLTGELEGTLAINITSQSACEFVSKMLDMTILEVNDDVIDGVGEIVNIVAGQVMSSMQGIKNFDLGVPTLIKGKQLEILNNQEMDVLSLTFDCGACEFEFVLIYKCPQSRDVKPTGSRVSNKDAGAMLREIIGEVQPSPLPEVSIEKKSAVEATAAHQEPTTETPLTPQPVAQPVSAQNGKGKETKEVDTSKRKYKDARSALLQIIAEEDAKQPVNPVVDPSAQPTITAAQPASIPTASLPEEVVVEKADLAKTADTPAARRGPQLILTEIEKDQSPPVVANPFVNEEASASAGPLLTGALVSDAMRELDTLLTELENRRPAAKP